MRPDHLTADLLRALLHYCPETGVFTNRVTRSSRAQVGQIAGSAGANGYLYIRIDHVLWYCHRLAWLYMTGVLPIGEVDHRDGKTANNRWANLRDVTHQANLQNRRCAQVNNKVGLLGVRKRARSSAFEATITVAGRSKYIGTFSDPQAAHAAVLAAKAIHHEGFVA